MAKAKVARPPLSPAGVAKLLLAAGAETINAPAKKTLFLQGERADALYFVHQGKVRNTVLSKQGREGTIALLTAGDFVGESSLASQPVYLHSAIAHTACEILKLDGEKMWEAMRASIPLAEYFMTFLLQRTIDAQADLVDHLFNSSEKRLARALLLLANFGHGGRLEPITGITQEILAERVGTTRSRISFFMNKFRRLGLIEYNGKIQVHSGLLNVVLHDPRIQGEAKPGAHRAVK